MWAAFLSVQERLVKNRRSIAAARKGMPFKMFLIFTAQTGLIVLSFLPSDVPSGTYRSLMPNT
jgi:hypothetical protein